MLLLVMCVATMGFAVASTYAKDGTRPLHDIVSELYGCPILPWHGEKSEAFSRACEEVAEAFNQSSVRFDRMNEVGVYLEKCLERALQKDSGECSIPKTRQGFRRKSGYPDLLWKVDDRSFYIEVKAFSTETIRSTQRTFYLSASADPKVNRAACHILVGFEIRKLSDSNYRILRFHCADLRNLPCKVKTEYNSSNSRLYGHDREDYQFSVPVESDENGS